MEAKKKRVMTKPMSELQKNILRHGRVLYYFNGLIQRMKQPEYDVRALISHDQLTTLEAAAEVLWNMRIEVIRGLQVQRTNILTHEIRSGKRCPKCSAVGTKLTQATFSCGALYVTCKKCKHAWEVTK